MLYPWPDGGELAARAGLLSVGGCRGGLAPGALLVHQVAEPLAELLDGLALVSEYQEPEPFGLLGLLYKQSPVFGVVMFTSPFWSPLAAVRWAVAAGPSACPG